MVTTCGGLHQPHFCAALKAVVGMQCLNRQLLFKCRNGSYKIKLLLQILKNRFPEICQIEETTWFVGMPSSINSTAFC